MVPSGRGLATVAIGIAFGCAAAPASLRFGVALQVMDEPPCVTFAAPDLMAGTPVTIEAFDPRRSIAARIRGARASCDPRAGVSGTAYSVDVAPGTAELGLAPATVDGPHGSDLTFARCSGAEGVHLTAWRHGARVWHQYHYLGYDVDSTCTAEETRP
jgi:hypothetical protein